MRPYFYLLKAFSVERSLRTVPSGNASEGYANLEACPTKVSGVYWVAPE
jgi:hypothetical protein